MMQLQVIPGQEAGFKKRFNKKCRYENERHFLLNNWGAVNLYFLLSVGSGYPFQILRNRWQGLQPLPGLLRVFHSYPAAIEQ